MSLRLIATSLDQSRHIPRRSVRRGDQVRLTKLASEHAA
jgi:hypothetical protein